jgi:peptidoglycan/LPS O-acetylase OafA/YrhL
VTATDIADGREPAAPEGRSRRRADIEGLRAVAVLLVVLFHADLAFVPGGFVGVDLFFVISGFVIMSMLLPRLESRGTLQLGWFYTRRLRRLLPALALTITVTALGSALFLSPLGPQEATASTGIAASLFSANIELYRAAGGGYFDLPTEANALLHTWSLSVEEQFYLFLPAFLILAWRGTKWLRSQWSAKRVTTLLLSVAVAASFVLSLITSFGHGVAEPEQFAFYASPTRAWEFGAGALLALAVPVLLRIPHRVAVVLGLLGAVLVAISAVAITATTPFPGFAAILPVAGAALLLVAGTVSTQGASAVLGVKPLVWIGGLSYSWYLWHWPIIVWARTVWPSADWVMVVAAALSLVPAWLAWRWVETPIRFNDRYLGRRIIPLVAVCILVPITACVALKLVGGAERESSAYAALVDGQRKHADTVRGCDRAAPLPQRKGDQCTWTTENPQGTVFLVGDSNAGQFTEAVAAAANEQGYDFTVATRSGCPFVDVAVRGGDVPDDCRRWVQETLRGLEEASPALVVIASDSTAYVNGDQFSMRDAANTAVAESSEDKARIWGLGLERVVRQLDEAGVPTVIVHTIPQFPDNRFMECPPVRVFGDEASCAASSSRQAIEAQQRATREAELAAVGGIASSRTIDVTDDLCTETQCVTFADGKWLYRDGAHLTVEHSKTLTDRFAELIGATAD